jgi:uncharacterized protein HemX
MPEHAALLLQARLTPPTHETTNGLLPMQKLIAVVLIAGLVWYGYGKYQHYTLVAAAQGNAATQQAEQSPVVQDRAPPPENAQPSQQSNFHCDGRTYCSQMTSCAEATFFLRNCPGTKMDGDGNGIPCERQWCG